MKTQTPTGAVIETPVQRPPGLAAEDIPWAKNTVFVTGAEGLPVIPRTIDFRGMRVIKPHAPTPVRIPTSPDRTVRVQRVDDGWVRLPDTIPGAKPGTPFPESSPTQWGLVARGGLGPGGSRPPEQFLKIELTKHPEGIRVWGKETYHLDPPWIAPREGMTRELTSAADWLRHPKQVVSEFGPYRPQRVVRQLTWHAEPVTQEPALPGTLKTKYRDRSEFEVVDWRKVQEGIGGATAGGGRSPRSTGNLPTLDAPKGGGVQQQAVQLQSPELSKLTTTLPDPGTGSLPGSGWMTTPSGSLAPARLASSLAPNFSGFAPRGRAPDFDFEEVYYRTDSPIPRLANLFGGLSKTQQNFAVWGDTIPARGVDPGIGLWLEPGTGSRTRSGTAIEPVFDTSPAQSLMPRIDTDIGQRVEQMTETILSPRIDTRLRVEQMTEMILSPRIDTRLQEPMIQVPRRLDFPDFDDPAPKKKRKKKGKKTEFDEFLFVPDLSSSLWRF